MNIKLLLSEVNQISKKYDLISKKTGGYFNIFDITNTSSDEVTICRVIYELLNPQGSHYQGNTYLKYFVEDVLKMTFSDYDYKTTTVYREYIIKDNRRIDIVIKTNDKIIPIEVKIYAPDQYKQCFDYYKYAKNSNLFYLTLNGLCPSEESAKGLTPINDNSKSIVGYEEVTQISFEHEILSWLQKCVSHYETIKIAPIREIILQLMGVIRKMTNLLLENKEDEIVQTLSLSKENMKSAIEIEKSLKICKIQMIKKVLESIEKRIDNKFKSDDKLPYYSYKENNYNLVNTYYDKKGSTCPGISYFIKSLEKENVDLLLRMEINNHLFIGFCTSYKNKFAGRKLDDSEINSLLKNYNQSANGWWIYWEYLPGNDKASSPNFKDFNEAYFGLFDDDKFNQFIDDCEKVIDNILNKIK